MDRPPLSMREVAPAELVPFLADCREFLGPGETMLGVLEGCRCFLILGDRTAFAYALKREGDGIWIQAAAGRGDCDLTTVGLDTIELQAGGMTVAFRTKRAGLVKKAARAGYTVAEQLEGWTVMKKEKICA